MLLLTRGFDGELFNDEKFLRLSTGARILVIFLLSTPDLGSTRADLPRNFKWLKPAELDDALKELSQNGVVEIDEASSFISIVEFMKYIAQ